MTDGDIDAIIHKIKNLTPGASCVYYTGMTRWMEKIPERQLKRLQDFFEKSHSRNHFFFTSRRLTGDKISAYDYIATKSRKIR